jgi:CubicO group peptidase (beta-lactamase class C family)
MRSVRLTRVFVALICLSQHQAGTVFGQATEVDSIHDYVLSEMARKRIPGVSVAVLRGDSILLARGYGFSNLELRAAASDSTVYQSGSLGKQFTSALVLMLAQQGRFKLDDRIVRWFPEGSGVWDSVTIRHLLTHTSGIHEYTDSTFDYRRDRSEDELVRFAGSRPLDFSPGERWAYSNTGYVLLGVLVHRVTGRFYGDLLQELIFRPLGMHSSRIISEADIVPHRAAGYEISDGRVANQSWVAPSLNTTADGSLYLTVRDLARWAVSLNHARIPDSAALRAAWTPVRLKSGGLYPYGFGWNLLPQRGHPRVGHTGSWQGFKTALYRYPEFGVTVIVLANLAQSEPGMIAEAIAGMLEPALQPPHRLAGMLPGVRPPASFPSLLTGISAGTSNDRVTPGLRHALTEDWREDLAHTARTVKAWRTLGCDEVRNRHMQWLSAQIERVCYYAGNDRDGDMVAAVFFTPEWRVAHLELSRY